MDYQDYSFTRKYLEDRYEHAVEQSEQAQSDYDVAVNERDTASDADRDSYDGQVDAASSELDYSKDHERAAYQDLTDLKLDPALRENAAQYEKENPSPDSQAQAPDNAGKDQKQDAQQQDNDRSEPGPLQSFAMKAGVAAVIAGQAMNPGPSGHAIQEEMQKNETLATQVESQYHIGQDQKGSEQQTAGQKDAAQPGQQEQRQDQPGQQQSGQQQPGQQQPGQQAQSSEQPAAEHTAPDQQPPEQSAQPQHEAQSQQTPQQESQQPSSEHASGQPAQDPHDAEARAPENREPDKAVPEQPTAPPSHPTEEVSAGPTKAEEKAEERQTRQDERSEMAADNTEHLHHGLEEMEKDKEKEQPKEVKESEPVKGDASFGAPGYPDPERSADFSQKLDSPESKEQQYGPMQGDVEPPAQEQAAPQTQEITGGAELGGQQADTTVHEREVAGDANFGAHNYPNPEHETEMAGAMSAQHGAEQTSQTYAVSSDGQPHEMPPTEHSASEMATAKQPDPPPSDPDHNH